MQVLCLKSYIDESSGQLRFKKDNIYKAEKDIICLYVFDDEECSKIVELDEIDKNILKNEWFIEHFKIVYLTNIEVLEQKLEKYNNEIEKLVNERTKFLDENMYIFAEFQIGDNVYNVKTGKITKVKEHYRYLKTHNEKYDTSFSVDCCFENGENTSCYGGWHPFVLLKDYKERNENYIRKVEDAVRYK